MFAYVRDVSFWTDLVHRLSGHFLSLLIPIMLNASSSPSSCLEKTPPTTSSIILMLIEGATADKLMLIAPRRHAAASCEGLKARN